MKTFQSKPFQTKTMTVRDVISQLQKIDPDALMIVDQWMSDDIRNVSEDLADLTEEQCRIVMAYMDKHYSTENGINNEVIISAVDECIEQKLFEVEPKY